MLNSTVQIKIKQRLNKLASQDYDNLECWQIVEAFNKSQIEWPRRQLVGTNILRQGDEQSTRRVDDLQVLLKFAPTINSVFSTYIETDSLPADYLAFKRIDLLATSDCCNDPRLMVAYLVEEGNIPEILRDDLKRPSFDWGETVCTLIGDKVRIYTNGTFQVSSSNLYYYRKPIMIQIQGCSDPYTGIISTTEVIGEFKDDIMEVLIDEACAVIAGDIESMNQYQRETQNAEKNT